MCVCVCVCVCVRARARVLCAVCVWGGRERRGGGGGVEPRTELIRFTANERFPFCSVLSSFSLWCGADNTYAKNRTKRKIFPDESSLDETAQ